jgi:hypothetical protein
MARYHNIDGVRIQFTAEEEIAKDVEEKALAEESVKLKAEYDAQEYARNRATEYPSVQELVVALYDTDDKADIEAKRAAVKAKYPKPK